MIKRRKQKEKEYAPNPLANFDTPQRANLALCFPPI